MTKMRTLKEAIDHIKSVDPDTALTYHALRTMVLSGVIPHVSIGKKRLVNLNEIEQYLTGNSGSPPVEPETSDKIRRISEYQKVG